MITDLEQEMLTALECVQALDARYDVGKATLERHGFDHSNRFGQSASEFVNEKVKTVIKKAREIK